MFGSHVGMIRFSVSTTAQVAKNLLYVCVVMGSVERRLYFTKNAHIGVSQVKLNIDNIFIISFSHSYISYVFILSYCGKPEVTCTDDRFLSSLYDSTLFHALLISFHGNIELLNWSSGCLLSLRMYQMYNYKHTVIHTETLSQADSL